MNDRRKVTVIVSKSYDFSIDELRNIVNPVNNNIEYSDEVLKKAAKAEAINLLVHDLTINDINNLEIYLFIETGSGLLKDTIEWK